MNGKIKPDEALNAILPTYGGASAANKPYAAIQIADLFYRKGDYDSCREWVLKVLDSKELSDQQVYVRVDGHWIPRFRQRLVASVILANAAAMKGKPEDIEMLESRIPKDELLSNVTIWYWNRDKGQNQLRTMLRFYKALAYMNSGNVAAAKDIAQLHSFNKGDIRVGNRRFALSEASLRLPK